MILAELTTILSGLPDPVLVIGSDQRLLSANKAAETLFEPGLSGRHILSVLRQPDVLVAIQEVLAGSDHREARYVTRGQVGQTFRLSISALHGADAGLDGALAVFTDISPIERANSMRSEFVANVSHELRSPLTALTGFIETLQGPAAEDAEARKSFLAIMQAEATRMHRLTDDLLSLSRVEANERVRPVDPVDIADILSNVLSSAKPLSDKSGIPVNLQTVRAPLTLPGDHDQLRQVFQNLIENAVKYSGKGEVQVTVSELAKFPGLPGAAVRIDVTDQGAGIDPVHLPRLTERFYRVDNHRSRGLGGTGLGLAIVKHIVNRHRGRLLIASEIGKGSVFSVVLPAA
jgi:two-component system phosphate regulon sensor histidine kinase PhoR